MRRRPSTPESTRAFVMSAVLFAIIMAWVGACVVTVRVAFGAELPCPPKHYTCGQVRKAIARYGEPAVRDKARSCGWSEEKIAEAERCR